LIGTAIVTDSLSVDLGGFKEIIRPSALTRALAPDADIRALHNHNSDHLLGRTTARTLRLRGMAKGLETRIAVPDTQAGRDTVTSVERRDLTGMSFAFRVPKDGDLWRVDGETVIREVLDMHVVEVSAVAFPAYHQTEISVQRGASAGAAGRHSRQWWEQVHRCRVA
jgi:HK97 family phage prohead protease